MLIKSETSSFRTYWKHLHPNRNWFLYWSNWKDFPKTVKEYFSFKKEKRLYSVSRQETYDSFIYLYRYLNNMLDMYGKEAIAYPVGLEFETWKSIIFEMRDLAKKLAEDNYENLLDRRIDIDTLFDWLKEYIDDIWW